MLINKVVFFTTLENYADVPDPPLSVAMLHPLVGLPIRFQSRSRMICLALRVMVTLVYLRSTDAAPARGG